MTRITLIVFAGLIAVAVLKAQCSKTQKS